MNKNLTLFYIHDPMCSWCYGFKPVLKLISKELKDNISIKYLLGGLAVDTDTTMPEQQQQQIKANWLRIEQSIPGIKFNYDFWTHCTPRRSTYPACRAVIAARMQHNKYEKIMIDAIQQAYYTNAQNPSDYSVLYQLANKTGLKTEKFKTDIHSAEINDLLSAEISLSLKIGANSYPSLYILKDNIYYPVVLDYNNADIILEHINSFI